jgi:hypothetical protein
LYTFVLNSHHNPLFGLYKQTTQPSLPFGGFWF